MFDKQLQGFVQILCFPSPLFHWVSLYDWGPRVTRRSAPSRPHTHPIWIKPPREATEIEVLERVENIVEKYQDQVMLLYDYDIAEETADWCRERGWQPHNSGNISGCEARCVVLLDCRLSPELITRGISVLVIINRFWSSLRSKTLKSVFFSTRPNARTINSRVQDGQPKWCVSSIIQS